MFNLFSKAEYPDRVTAGVVQQNLEGDEGCLSKFCKLMEEEVGGGARGFSRVLLALCAPFCLSVSPSFLPCFLLCLLQKGAAKHLL